MVHLSSETPLSALRPSLHLSSHLVSTAHVKRPTRAHPTRVRLPSADYNAGPELTHVCVCVCVYNPPSLLSFIPFFEVEVKTFLFSQHFHDRFSTSQGLVAFYLFIYFG